MKDYPRVHAPLGVSKAKVVEAAGRSHICWRCGLAGWEDYQQRAHPITNKSWYQYRRAHPITNKSWYHNRE